jgi:hypothetical protein
MARRQSNDDLAFDLTVEHSSDFDAPPSSHTSKQWRAPRPASWPPPLPSHRVPVPVKNASPSTLRPAPVRNSTAVPKFVPLSQPPVIARPPRVPTFAPAAQPAITGVSRAPTFVPADRFRVPVSEASAPLSALESRFMRRAKPRVWPWALLVVALGTAASGYEFRMQIPFELTTARSWLQHHVPSDLAARPRIAYERVRGYLVAAIARLHGTPAPFGAPFPAARAPEATPATDNPAPTAVPVNPATAPAPSNPGSAVASAAAHPRVVDISALPVAPAPRPIVGVHSAPGPASARIAPAPKPVVASASSEPKAALPSSDEADDTSSNAPARALAPVAKPVSAAPAPEPGSLDDLIRKEVEKEQKHAH